MITTEQFTTYFKTEALFVAIYHTLSEELKMDKKQWDFQKGIYFVDGQPFISYKGLGIIDFIGSSDTNFKCKKIAEKLNEFVLSYKLNLLFPD